MFAGTKDYNLDDIDFKELRAKTYEKYLKARIESAKKQQEAKDSDDEIEDCPVSSSPPSSSILLYPLLDSVFDPVQLCNDDLPEVYCKECKIKVSLIK